MKDTDIINWDYDPNYELPDDDILDRIKRLYGLFQENAVNYPNTMIAKGANAMMDILDKLIDESEQDSNHDME